jgi:type IV secretory pathway protease TraF
LIVNRTPIKKGSIVLFKPDQNIGPEQLGFDRGYEARELPLLKRVVALAGDVVSISSSHHQWRTSAQQCTTFP